MKLSAFDAALLAQASYAYLDNLDKKSLKQILTDKDLEGTFSQSQAEEFAAPKVEND